MNGYSILSDHFTGENDEIHELEDNPGSIFRVIHGREGFDDETLLIRFLEDEHDLEELLGADDRELELQFYNEGTPNQWNIQLFWVYEDNETIDESIRQRLETDTRFAIRRCVPFESLEDFITPLEKSLKEIDEISPDFKRQDLIQRIIDHDLEFLFNRDTSRKQKLKHVKEGGDRVGTEVLPEGNRTTARRAFIDTTQLGEFRPHAMRRELNAAPFTLLYGRNGTGKTSLLDGTAMGLVGQIRRGEARADAYEGLGVTLEGDRDALPTNSSDVNDRVADWFGFRPQSSANRYIEFYRVNYHEAGETTRLLQSGTELEIERTLRRFLYGEDLMYAQNEKEELTELLNQEIEDLTDELQNVEEELQQLKERQSELDSIFSALDTATQDLSPAATKIIHGEAELDNITNAGDVQSPADRIDRWTTWEQRFKRLRESLEALSEQEISFETPSQLQRRLQGDLEQLEEYLNELDSAERLLEEQKRIDTLEEYYGRNALTEAPASVVLVSLILRSQGIDVEEIHLLTETLDETDIEETDPEYANSLGEWRDTVASELNKKLEQLKQRREKLEEINDLEKRRRQLQAEIREDTEEYLSMTDEVQYCPACYIEQSSEAILTRDKPDHLHEGTEGVPNSLIEQIAVFEDALSILSMSAWDNVHQDIDSQFNDVCDFDSFQELWSSYLSEGETDIIFPDASESLVQSLVGGLRSDPDYDPYGTSIETALESARSRLESNLADHVSTIPEFEPSKAEVQKSREQFLDRRDELESGLTIIQNHWPDDAWHDDISIKSDIQTLRTTVADMEERPSIPASSQKLSNEISEVEENISRLQERLSQYKQGISRMASAFEGARSEEKLDEFVRQHMSVITTLFKAFQRPYDFKSVKLVDGKVKVIRRNEERPVEIIQMSSGQRAALALAIFVTNNLAHDSAPPLMMLDEPFAHLDDVNTISFFNLLIELATREERQIMFATANEDIATLLDRKVGESTKFEEVEIDEPE
jgi:exonuclease SbcC